MNALWSRIAFFRNAFATPHWRIFKYVWLLLGTYDLVLSQLLPKSIAGKFPKTVEALTAVSDLITWQVWAGAGVTLLVMASLEYSYRKAETVAVPSLRGDQSSRADAGYTLAEDRKTENPTKSADTTTHAHLPLIAVLPFENLSNDSDQQYFADGVAETLIDALSKFRSMRVIGRATSFSYRGQSVDHAKIRKELGARYIIEGTVARSANQVRVSVGLIDAEVGTRLWSRQYDGVMSEIFSLQDQIVRRIAGIIEPNVQAAEVRRAASISAANPQAYDRFLRALEHFNHFNKEGFERALKELDTVIDSDSSFSTAWALKADVVGRMILGGWRDPEENTPILLEAALRAVEISPDDGHILSIAAWALAVFGRDLDKSIMYARQALDMNPNSLAVLSNSAWPLIYNAEFDLAISNLILALELNPYDPRAYTTYSALAGAHFYARRFEEAIDYARRSITLAPRLPVPRGILTAALYHLGRVDEARASANELLNISPFVSMRQARILPFRHDWMRDMILTGLRASGMPDQSQNVANPTVG